MSREKRLRLSKSEIQTVKATKQLMYGNDPVPFGLVVREACERLINDDDDSENQPEVNY